MYLEISDVHEHERRLSGRDRSLTYVGEPTWSDVQRRRADHAAWSDAVLEFDTASESADEVAAAITARLDST
ncbi:MAG: hypothetical protein ACTIA5_05380 [Brachybacterium tyrofermentans]|uniref:hypothetical protein n=1 Tax=unclassified Brachybacterium TaxID=2623841 RepID=UPI003FBA04DE